jgi:hypothetical protein
VDVQAGPARRPVTEHYPTVPKATLTYHHDDPVHSSFMHDAIAEALAIEDRALSDALELAVQARVWDVPPGVQPVEYAEMRLWALANPP